MMMIWPARCCASRRKRGICSSFPPSPSKRQESRSAWTGFTRGVLVTRWIPNAHRLYFLELRLAELGPHIFAAQYQQDPIPPGGDIIKPEWIQRYDAPPERDSSCQIIQSWDPASRVGKQNDYSACSTWLYRDGKYFLLHMLRGRYDFPTLKKLVISHARVYKPDTILIEEDIIGKALIDELNGQPTAEFSVVGIKPEYNKRTRMLIQSNKFASGQVFFPNERFRG